jgi:hypothetical protein
MPNKYNSINILNIFISAGYSTTKTRGATTTDTVCVTGRMPRPEQADSTKRLLEQEM